MGIVNSYKRGFLTELNEGNQLTLRLNSSKKIHISQDGRFLRHIRFVVYISVKSTRLFKVPITGQSIQE